MTMTMPARQPKGVPAGGQFAATGHAAPAGVTLTETDDTEARRSRQQLESAAGFLTGHGTIAAREKMGAMTDTQVAHVQELMRQAFRDEVLAAVDRPGLANPRAQLAATLGPILGTGTSGALERMGSLTDADVDRVLGRLGDVWAQATTPPEADDHDDAPAPDVMAATPAFEERLAEDIENGDAFVHDGRVFQRPRENVLGDTPYAIAVRLNRPVTDAEMEQLAGLTGYAYARTGGERAYDGPERVDDRTFVIPFDTTKGRAYRHLDVFVAELAGTVRYGSPVRKTDRSGPGTAGTRLVEGMGEDLHPEVFYDNVADYR